MRTYPKDFPDVLASVHEDIKAGRFKGHSKDALAEAWHRWREKRGIPEQTVQQRRYAYRKSFENPRLRTQQTFTYQIEFIDGKQAFVRLPRIKTSSEAIASIPFLEKRFKKPIISIWDEYDRDGWGVITAEGYSPFDKLNPATTKRQRPKELQKMTRKNPIAIYNPKICQCKSWSQHFKKKGKKLYCGRCGGLIKMRKIERKNPIAIYNPYESRPRIKFTDKKRRGKLSERSPFKGYRINPGLRLLYGSASIPKVYGKKTSGPNKGKLFVHHFNTNVKIYGLPKGGLMIESLDGSRLWADEKDVDRFDHS